LMTAHAYCVGIIESDDGSILLHQQTLRNRFVEHDVDDDRG
jgi:hypothetical protein